MAEPFFISEANWIPIPSDFSVNIVQGKGYDSEDGATGKALWQEITERLITNAESSLDPGPATVAAVESRYGKPMLLRPRLGQGAFGLIVTDVYVSGFQHGQCALPGHRASSVIKPYGLGGPHQPENGLLLRSDLHTLFDEGYMTVDANELEVIVSGRIKEEFENGTTTSCTGGPFVCRVNEQFALTGVS